MRRAATLGLAAIAALGVASAAQAAKRLPGERPGVTQHGMQCEPRRAGPRGTLHIRLPARHGHDFAVTSPKGELYFVAFAQPDRASAVQPLIAEGAFRTMTTLTVAIAEFQGIPWRTAGGKRPIFRESGTYTIVVSPALETEDPAIDGWCKVRFRR
jgi:hypothetical protein